MTPRAAYRLLEILPGAAVWLTLILAIMLSFIQPLWAVIFIIIFDVYWFIRVSYVMIYVVAAFRRYRQTQAVDWRSELERQPNWRDIHHLIILPTYREPYEVLAGTFRSLAAVDYPVERFFVVLATEGREAARIRPIAERLQREFSSSFGWLLVTEHPDGRPGEIASKGANIAWAGKAATDEISRRGINVESVLVSTFDADSIAHPQYFAYLTTTFLRHPNRLRSSYQPVPVFHNNAWEALFLMRVVANSTTFWLLSETQRPDRMFTFSSHSMPLRALIDVGFWQTDIVNEDSRIFVQCFLHYDGDYTVTPLYLPISMDTVQAHTWLQSFRNQYKQIQRWAYGGVENFPFSVWNFVRNPIIPLWTRLRLTWIQWEGIYSWATAPLLIFFLGWLPFLTTRSDVQSTAIFQNAPGTIQGIMYFTMFGLVLSAIIATLMLPPRPVSVGWPRMAMMVLQWLFLPVTMILFGALPAIDAQTRMMLGRYMGFVVTEKQRSTRVQSAADKSG